MILPSELIAWILSPVAAVEAGGWKVLVVATGMAEGVTGRAVGATSGTGRVGKSCGSGGVGLQAESQARQII